MFNINYVVSPLKKSMCCSEQTGITLQLTLTVGVTKFGTEWYGVGSRVGQGLMFTRYKVFAPTFSQILSLVKKVPLLHYSFSGQLTDQGGFR